MACGRCSTVSRRLLIWMKASDEEVAVTVAAPCCGTGSAPPLQLSRVPRRSHLQLLHSLAATCRMLFALLGHSIRFERLNGLTCKSCLTTKQRDERRLYRTYFELSKPSSWNADRIRFLARLLT